MAYRSSKLMPTFYLTASIIFCAAGILPFIKGNGSTSSAMIATGFGLCALHYSRILFTRKKKTAPIPCTDVTQEQLNFSVTFNDAFICTKIGNSEVNRIHWGDITRVGIEKASGDTPENAGFWGIYAGEDIAIAYPNDSIGSADLLIEMQKRLPNFNSSALKKSLGATITKDHVLWERSDSKSG
jgi:hypothetical protein